MVDAIWNPATIFLATLAVAALLYLWGRAMAPKPTPAPHKREMYTGGEPPKPQEFRPSYAFFHVAFFFTVLHVAALVLVTAFSGASGLLIAIYFGVIALAIAALSWR